MVEAFLRVSAQELESRLERNEIIGLRAVNGALLLPGFQFRGRDGRPIPRLSEVWPILLGAYNDEWNAAAWLATPAPEIDGRTAAEILQSGDQMASDQVIQDAQHDAEIMRP